jgi:hypothetical protein
MDLTVSLYELTYQDYTYYANINELVERCELSAEIIKEALDHLPIDTTASPKKYRIEGPSMHIIPVIRILSIH